MSNEFSSMNVNGKYEKKSRLRSENRYLEYENDMNISYINFPHLKSYKVY